MTPTAISERPAAGITSVPFFELAFSVRPAQTEIGVPPSPRARRFSTSLYACMPERPIPTSEVDVSGGSEPAWLDRVSSGLHAISGLQEATPAAPPSSRQRVPTDDGSTPGRFAVLGLGLGSRPGWAGDAVGPAGPGQDRRRRARRARGGTPSRGCRRRAPPAGPDRPADADPTPAFRGRSARQ
jgi:hypothetical protein